MGDLIDRGPDQAAVLATVREMVDSGVAHALMGNHEFNAVSYATDEPPGSGRYLREHSDKNDRQSAEFLRQLDSPARADAIEWFKSLPLWLDLGGLRVVHACWHDTSIDLLTQAFGGNRFPDSDDSWVAANRRGNPIHAAVEVLLKGPEMDLRTYGLPSYLDKGGDVRDAARVRWWNGAARTIRDLIDLPTPSSQPDGLPFPEIPPLECTDADKSFAYTSPVPVIYGHHWRQWRPERHLDWTERTACVDFSAVRGGPLVAYRWSGETRIDPDNYFAYPTPLGSQATGPNRGSRT